MKKGFVQSEIKDALDFMDEIRKSDNICRARQTR